MSETSDSLAREHAIDPLRNVVLEASAGTGKTRVLVDRYVSLLEAGVEPLPAVSHDVHCPRCRQPIATGTPAVRCPGSEVWHHGVNEPSCWSYAPTRT